MIDITKSTGKTVGLPIEETKINVSINEDNSGALILAKNLPPQFTPQRKHYAANTKWFCEEMVNSGIKICKFIQ